MQPPIKLGALYRNLKDVLPDLEARIIIRERTGQPWSAIIANPDIPVGNLEQVESDVKRRLGGEPLSRIYGEREFHGLTFKISPAVLDPRPDTETLVDVALQKFHVKQAPEILDLGTGSGCILISLLHALPQARGTGVDVSSETLEIARENARTIGVIDRAEFTCGDWGTGLPSGGFDLVVSNPPYIASSVIPNLEPEVRNHDPILALDGGKDGLQAYKNIFPDLPRLLKKGGIALFEIGYDQEDAVMRLGKESRIRPRIHIAGVHRDLAGRPRVVEISRGDK